MRRKKSPLKTHCRFVIDTTPPLEKAHKDDSNATVKGCTMTLKEAIHAVRAMTWKTNQIKYHEMKISCLYIINLKTKHL